jgi:hypothetical protein
MKKALTITALIATIASGWSQGVVDVRNSGVSFATTADRLVRDGAGGLLTGTNYIGQLYWALGNVTDENLLSAMTPVPGGNPTVRFRPASTTAPGTWIGGNRTTGAAAGSLLTLQIRVWDIAFGNTWEQARGQGQFGTSGLFGYTVPQPSDTPDKYFIENFRAFNLVPEPSVIILGAIGAAAFLLRRRKN